MSRITKAMLEEARRQGFEAGRYQGRAEGIKEEQARNAGAARTAHIQLINAVGQTMNVNAALIQGLAATLDNGPR